MLSRSVAALVFALVIAAPGFGAIVGYSNTSWGGSGTGPTEILYGQTQSSWAAALQSLTVTEDFNLLTTGLRSSYDRGDTRFVGFSNSTETSQTRVFSATQQSLTSSIYIAAEQMGATRGLRTYLTTPMTAFAFNFWLVNQSGASPGSVVSNLADITVTYSGGAWETFTLNFAAPGPAAFFGLRSDVGITRVELRSGSRVAMDNWYSGVAGPLTQDPLPPDGETPEIATLLYTAIGLAVMLAGARRRTAAKPTAA